MQKKTIIVGLSGGADSVAMLHMLSQDKEAQLVVTHCNFHLRGEESMRDQRFCEKLCEEWHLPLIVKDFDTHLYMQEHHLSLEMAARELRYNWWEELAKELENSNRENCSDGMKRTKVQIAVAHHQDDSIETALMNLMRGTGIKGLTGIPELRGRITRPLLHMSRTEILSYIEEQHLSYVTDSTNLENEVMRNKIRNLLLPLMEEINPNARQGIALTMQHLAQSELLANERIEEILSNVHVHHAEAGIEWEEWLLTNDVSDEAMIDTLLYYLRERYKSVCRHGQLLYTEPDMSQMILESEPVCTILERKDLCESLDGKQEYIYADAEQVRLPLSCRHWRQGDRIQPLGMKGEKLVSDLFTNAHYSPLQKTTTWIVCDATGRIVWVKGLRSAEWCKVSNDSARVIKVKV